MEIGNSAFVAKPAGHIKRLGVDEVEKRGSNARAKRNEQRAQGIWFAKLWRGQGRVPLLWTLYLDALKQNSWFAVHILSHLTLFGIWILLPPCPAFTTTKSIKDFRKCWCTYAKRVQFSSSYSK